MRFRAIVCGFCERWGYLRQKFAAGESAVGWSVSAKQTNSRHRFHGTGGTYEASENDFRSKTVGSLDARRLLSAIFVVESDACRVLS